MDKYCWCQTWESDKVLDGHHYEQETATPAPEEPEPEPEYLLQTISQGTYYENLAEKTELDVAYCRCHTEDFLEGISICNTGCGDPNTVCNDSFGCAANELACNNQKCTCKPDGIETNTMTYQECHDQCTAIGMVPVTGAEGVAASINTGCNINGLETWVVRTEL